MQSISGFTYNNIVSFPNQGIGPLEWHGSLSQWKYIPQNVADSVITFVFMGGEITSQPNATLETGLINDFARSRIRRLQIDRTGEWSKSKGGRGAQKDLNKRLLTHSRITT